MTTSHTNVDPAELAKFSDLAHRWWDPESEFRPLHQINPLRLEWINGLVPLAGLKVVDIGCGGGILADAMARKGAQVLGVDLATKSLKVAQLHALEAGTQGVQYREVSAEALAAEQAQQFDVVTCMEMLEHVPDPAAVVKACAQLVKPGGWVFFSTLNRNPKSFLFACLFSHNGQRFRITEVQRHAIGILGGNHAHFKKLHSRRERYPKRDRINSMLIHEIAGERTGIYIVHPNDRAKRKRGLVFKTT